MATATYVKTTALGAEPDRKSAAQVTVQDASLPEVTDAEGKIISLAGERTIEIGYWPSLIDQWTAAGVRAYVEAEALFALGFYADARAHVSTVTEPWAAQWTNEHPDPTPIVPEVDPLA